MVVIFFMEIMSGVASKKCMGIKDQFGRVMMITASTFEVMTQ